MTSTVQSASSASPSGSGSVALVERALWRMAGGRATDDDRSVVEAEPHQALLVLDRLIVAAVAGSCVPGAPSRTSAVIVRLPFATLVLFQLNV